MKYTLEYGGGLGDIFYQLYERGSYNVLRDLKEDDTAEIILITHNPFARELFDFHPKVSQFTIHNPGYWHISQDAEKRKEYGFPPIGSNYKLPIKDNWIKFYPAPSDEALIKEILKTSYMLISPGAGELHRNIPSAILQKTVAYLLEHTPHHLVIVGRNYERHGRTEPSVIQEHPRIINCVDKLSVPGTATLVQSALGLVTCHSALNLLGWCEKIPQLLLYPQSVLDQHAPNGNFDHWMFGAKFPTTVHTLFNDFTEEHLKNFVSKL